MQPAMQLNYGAVLAAMAAAIVIGFLWFGPILGLGADDGEGAEPDPRQLARWSRQVARSVAKIHAHAGEGDRIRGDRSHPPAARRSTSLGGREPSSATGGGTAETR